jgi:chromosome segregation ATPase
MAPSINRAQVVARQADEHYEVGVNAQSQIGLVELAIAVEKGIVGVVLQAPQLGQVALVLRRNEEGTLQLDSARQQSASRGQETLLSSDFLEAESALQEAQQRASQLSQQIEVHERASVAMQLKLEQALAQVEAVVARADEDRQTLRAQIEAHQTTAASEQAVTAQAQMELERHTTALAETRAALEGQQQQTTRLAALSHTHEKEFIDLKRELATLTQADEIARAKLELQEAELLEVAQLKQQVDHEQSLRSSLEEEKQLLERRFHEGEQRLATVLNEMKELQEARREVLPVAGPKRSDTLISPAALGEAREVARKLFAEVEQLTLQRNEAREVARKLHQQLTATSGKMLKEEADDSPMKVTVSPSKVTVPGH